MREWDVSSLFVIPNPGIANGRSDDLTDEAKITLTEIA